MSQEELAVFNKLEGRFSETTISNFKRFFKRIKGIADDEKLDLRTDSKEVVKEVAEQFEKISTQRTMLKAMVNYFQLIGEGKRKHFFVYRDRVDDLTDEMEDTPKELTERQNKVDYQDFLENFIKFVDDNGFDLSEMGREILLFSFYILLPPRRLDYVEMVYETKFKNLDSKTNYLIEKPTSWTFVFNVFKTKKGFRQQRFKIENPILIKILENEEFTKGKRIYSKTKRSFQRDFKKVAKRFSGEELSIQDMRVLHSSDVFAEFADFIEKLKKDSDMMGHQISTKIKTYIRIKSVFEK